MKKNNVSMNEAIKGIIEAEAREVRLELGADFSKAVGFYKKVNGLTHLSIGEYREAGRVFKTLAPMLDGGDYEAGAVAKAFADAYGLEVPEGDEAVRNFINAQVARFRLDVTTEILHKDTVELIKGSLDDLEYDSAGHLYMDSSKASVFTKEQIVANRDESGKVRALRIVATSENGFMREAGEILADMGFTGVAVMLYVGEQSEDQAVEVLLDNKRRELYRNGFTDIKTGTHYVFAMRGASMTRKANTCFIPGTDWNDTFKFWFKVTGLGNEEKFIKAFKKEVNFSKMLARLSSRASSSFSLDATYPEIGAEVRKFNILYVKDVDTFVTKKYHTLVAPNTFEECESERKGTLQDGAMLISLKATMLIALGLRVISRVQYEAGLALWNAHISRGGTSADASGSLLQFLSDLPVFQIRHGSMKGMAIKADLETIGVASKTYGKVCTVIPAGHTADELVNISEFDGICPESVRKYMDGEWSEYPLEICGYLKDKKGTVNLNPQFINALEWETPNALLPIVKDILRQADESLDDPAKAMAFHHIFGEGSEVSSMLGDVLRTDATLINEVQVQSWRKAQYEKLINGLALGRIPVPGTYTYMVSDPLGFLAKTFGIDLPCLGEGEYYFNGKTCKAGFFRSPLIHPFEAQKVQLVEHPAYTIYKDVALFNIFDGGADKMGGGDYDGDTCAVIPDDTWQGHIIVSGIRDIPYDVWEPACGQQKRYFVPNTSDAVAMSNIINYLVESSKVDRTGIITNHGTAALELSNHLRGLVFFAKHFGVDTIRFVHPKTFGEEGKWGSNFAPRKYGNVLMTRGFVEGKWSKKDNGYVWLDDKELSIIGDKTIDEVLSLSNDYLRLVEIVRVLQGREIDGAKTGVYAEGPRFNPETGDGNDFTENVKVKFTSKALVDRQFSLGRITSTDKKSANTYVSVSPWGRVHSYVNEEMSKENSVLNRLDDNGIVKTAHFVSLLSAEEKAHFERLVVVNGEQKNLIEFVKMWKDHYVNQVKTFFDSAREYGVNVDNEEQADDAFGTLNVASIKSKVYEALEQFATANNIPMTTMAVACYVANFAKSKSIANSNSFAWLFAGDLLEVASRNNAKYRWVRVPSEGEVSVFDGILSVSGRGYSRVEAEDCASCLTAIINGRRYAWIHMVSENAVKPVYEGRLYEGKTYTYSLYGFAHYGIITPASFSKFEGCSVLTVMCKDGVNAGRVELFAKCGDRMVPFCSIANSKEIQANVNLAGLDGRTLKITSVGEAKDKSVKDASFIVIA